MYASHWSHSQRCGIGGVETDRLVNAIRGHGPAAGLFGAKVTAGGEGGELVLLMLNDEQAHAALEQVASQARTETRQPVRVYDGALPGAESFQAPGMVDPAGAV
jgi:galactokinase